MPSFDKSKAYAAQEEVYFDDGREIELLHFVYSHKKLEQIRGRPEGVLAAIDEYGRTKKYLMNVGDDKGKIVTDIIAQRKPKVMIELGGYVGYSAILFASAMRAAGGERYYVLEYSPEFAAVTSSLVNLAGLSSIVEVIVGAAGDSIRRLTGSSSSPSLGQADMLFLDHIKPAYLPDLKTCETLGVVAPGTMVVADNVIKPGNPPYLEYVRMSVADKRKAVKGGSEEGDPNLVYKSYMVESFEPTGIPDGVEITDCVERESS